MRFAILSTLFKARNQSDTLLVTTEDARELTEDELTQFHGGNNCHHNHHEHHHHCWNNHNNWDNWNNDWYNNWNYCGWHNC